MMIVLVKIQYSNRLEDGNLLTSHILCQFTKDHFWPTADIKVLK